MLGGRPWDEWIARYAQSHRHPVNRFCHTVGIPLLVKLYEERLPIAPSAAKAVREMLIEPPGVVVNAAGRHPFNAPWPAGTIVSGKTGSATDASGRGVRWLIGHVKKGSGSYVFVSCVIGPQELEANAAIDLAARSLRDAQVL